jgi:hypothetical protein
VKGYEVSQGGYPILEPDEIAAVVRDRNWCFGAPNENGAGLLRPTPRIEPRFASRTNIVWSNGMVKEYDNILM